MNSISTRNKQYILLLAFIIGLSAILGTSLLNKSSYKATTEKTLIFSQTFDQTKFVTPSTSDTVPKYFKTYTGPFYLNPVVCNIVKSGSSNLTKYGFKSVGNNEYIFSPLLSNKVSYNRTYTYNDLGYYSDIYCGGNYLGSSGTTIEMYVLNNNNTATNVISKLEIYIDPSRATFGSNVLSAYLYKIFYKDGTVFEIGVPNVTQYTLTKSSKDFKMLYGGTLEDRENSCLPVFAGFSGFKYNNIYKSLGYFRNKLIGTFSSGEGKYITVFTSNADYFNPRYDLDINRAVGLYGLTTTQYCLEETAISVEYFGCDAQSTIFPGYIGLPPTSGYEYDPCVHYGTNYMYGEYPFHLLEDGIFNFYPEANIPTSDLQVKLDEIAAQVSTLNTQLTTTQSKLDAANEKIVEYTTELAKIKASLSAAGVDTSNVNTIQSNITNLKSTINQLNIDKANLESQKEQLTDKVAELTQEIADLEDDKTDLTNQVSSLQLQLNSANNSISNLTLQLDNAEATITGLQDDLLAIKVLLGLDPDATQTEIINKIRELQSKLSSYEEDIKEIGETLDASNPSDILSVQTKAESLVREMEALKESISELRTIVTSLPTGSSGDMVADINNLINEFNTQNSQLSDYRTFISELIGDLNIDSNSSFEDILNAIADIQNELENYKTTLNNINSTINIDSSSSLQQSLDKVKDIVKEVDRLNTVFISLQTKLQDYVALNPDLSNTERTQEALDNFISLYDETKEKADSLSLFLRDCIKLLGLDDNSSTNDVLLKIKDLQIQLLEANQKIDRYEQNLIDMSETVSIADGTMSPEQSAVVSSKVSDMNNELIATKDELQKLKDDLNSISGTGGSSSDVANLIQSLRDEVETAMQKINTMTTINNKIALALGLSEGSDLDSILNEINNLHTQISDLQTNNSSLSDKLNTAIINNTTLTTENNAIKDANDYLKQLTDEQLAQLLLLINQNLKSTVSSSDLKEINTKLETIQSSTEVKELRENISDLDDRLTSMETKLDAILNALNNSDALTKEDLENTSTAISNEVVENLYSSVFGGGSDSFERIQPVTTPEPSPSPQTSSEPQPSPQPSSQPSFEPQPQPSPKPQPSPQPSSSPAPTSTPQPSAEPSPSPQPQPQPSVEPTPTPQVMKQIKNIEPEPLPIWKYIVVAIVVIGIIGAVAYFLFKDDSKQ